MMAILLHDILQEIGSSHGCASATPSANRRMAIKDYQARDSLVFLSGAA